MARDPLDGLAIISRLNKRIDFPGCGKSKNCCTTAERDEYFQLGLGEKVQQMDRALIEIIALEM